MNEKIKQWAKQAGYGFEIHLSQSGDEEYIWGGVMETRKVEKFAELIIKECAKYIEDSNMVGIPRENIPGGMKRYFGVEE